MKRKAFTHPSERSALRMLNVHPSSTSRWNSWPAENKDYEGLISGVTEWGIYVEIVETKCEGMIRMSDMTDDFYEFDEKNYRIVATKDQKIYTLADKIKCA